jgi:hypothetical protein
MIDIGRRQALKLALGGTALAAGWQMLSGGEAKAATGGFSLPPSTRKGHKNTLVGLGMHGNRHQDVFLNNIPSALKGNPNYRSSHSVITEIDPKSGDATQSVLPMASAHAAMRLPTGNLFISAHHKTESLLIDEDHKVIKSYYAPAGYVYGGHGWLLPEQNVAMVALRHADPKTTKDTGLLMVYDADTFELLDQYDSGGIHPHEIRVLPDQKEFVVTHYGDVHSPNPSGLHFHVLEPKLSVYDLETFKKKADYIQPIDAIYTHMDVGAYGDVYAISNQYLYYSKLSDEQLAAQLKRMDIKHDHNVSFMSNKSRRIAIPGAVIKVNPKTGEREDLIVSEEAHLRSQSVAAHSKSKRVFATYVYSNNLVVVDEEAKTVSAVDAFKYGCHAVRGVAEIPDSDYIAVADQDRGVAIVNAKTMEMVNQFPTQLLQATHIFAA